MPIGRPLSVMAGLLGDESMTVHFLGKLVFHFLSWKLVD